MNISKLSNSFSTGEGGGNFERHVQAVFLLTLLIDGFSPILKRPIARLEFQAKRLGYDIDDLVIISTGKDAPKILCQIKHHIDITDSSRLFQEVINAAWSDFNKANFNQGKDKIVLATGILAKDSVVALRYIYEQANSSANAEDFIERIEKANFTNQKVREKLTVLKQKLKSANGNKRLTNNELWCFCKSFVLLVFDLDYESSVNQMLVYSLINCQSSMNPVAMWAELSEHAGIFNQSAASVCLEDIPDHIKEMLNPQKRWQIPTPLEDSIDPSELWVCLALIGCWNEKNENDIKIVEQITGQEYHTLTCNIRRYIGVQNSFITFQNGIFKIKNRKELLRLAESFLSDQVVEQTFLTATELIKQKSNRFDENNNLSFVVPETGEFQSSEALRKGIVQGLCILSNCGVKFSACSNHVCEVCSSKMIREIFLDCDWIRLASASDLLPLIAEIHPKYYLEVLEEYIQSSRNQLPYLFPEKEENPLFSQNFIYGIIWSIQVLAWEENLVVKCVRCLGELAQAILPDGDKATLVVNAIKDILLPWHPQTLASPDKQKNAIQALQVEIPEIGWLVIKELLPGGSSVTGGTAKPKYLSCNIPEELSVSDEDIRNLFKHYASVAVTLADGNVQKLEDLTEYIDYFDEAAINCYLSGISANAPLWSDEKKFPLWNRLNNTKYRILLTQKDKGAPDTSLYHKLCSTIEILVPQDTCVSYRRLYLSEADEYMLQEDNFTNEWKKREEDKKRAVLDIYNNHGVQEVQEFGLQVNNLYDVGMKLGDGIDTESMQSIFQKGADKAILTTFLYSIVNSFVKKRGMKDLLATNLHTYDSGFISDVLSQLYLSRDLLEAVSQLLPKQEQLFWKKISVPTVLDNTGDGDVDIEYAVDQLIKVRRPVAAVNLCGHVHGDFPVSSQKVSQILKMAATMESEERIEARSVWFLVEKLQSAAKDNIVELSEIELLYLPWLNDFSRVWPRALYYRMANDAEFFCELLQVSYKRRHGNARDEEMPPISSGWSKRMFQLFFKFRVVPGTDWKGAFHEDVFTSWLEKVKMWARENDRYEVAMQTIGSGLSYAPVQDKLPCDKVIMNALNAGDACDMRTGYCLGVYNQRGVHFVDPEGKEERALAEKYRRYAEEVENLGYSRFSESLREISDQFIQEAEKNALEANSELF